MDNKSDDKSPDKSYFTSLKVCLNWLGIVTATLSTAVAMVPFKPISINPPTPNQIKSIPPTIKPSYLQPIIQPKPIIKTPITTSLHYLPSKPLSYNVILQSPKNKTSLFPASHQKSVTQLAQANGQPTPANSVVESGLKLTLSDVVVLALQNNKEIKNAYLERIAQRQDLIVAEDKFNPNFTPEIFVSLGRNSGSNTFTTTIGDVGLGARVSVKVPTGGELSLALRSNNSSFSGSGGFGTDLFQPAFQLSFEQPLLRGAGVNLNKASIDITRLTEQSNLLDLKSTLTNTITDAILSFRQLIQAQEQLKIELQSLEFTQQTLEINRALIEAGRKPRVELIQSEAELANQQVRIESARNQLESTKLNLIDSLDIDKTTNISSVEVPTAVSIALDLDNLRRVALENRPDYLKSQLNQQINQLQLLIAQDGRRWDLSFVTDLSNTIDSSSDVRAGLRLSHEFGDRTKEQQFQRSRINLLQSENILQNLNESLDIQVVNGVRNVNSLFVQVQTAQQARELAERQLQFEQEKLKLGRSEISQIIDFQKQLAQAKNTELNAIIEYLNALTNLDKTTGTTLQTWRVTVEEN